MNRYLSGARSPGSSWLIISAAILLALVLGLASVVLPKIVIATAIVLLVATPTYIWRPAWLIVPVIAFQMYFPSQPVSDVVTVLFLARTAASLFSRWPEMRSAITGPLMRPVAVIVLCITVSFLAAATVLQNGKSPIYQDGRVFVYWLWIIPFLAYSPRQNPTRWFTGNILAIATIASVLAVFQGTTGISLITTGRIAQLETLGNYSSDITRVQIPGFVFVTFGLFLSAANLIKRGFSANWWLHLALAALFALAIVFNFGRALWFWSVLGVAIVGFLMGWRALAKLGIWATILSAVLLCSLSIARPRIVDTIVDRVSSVFKEGGGRTSFGWREIENQNAIKVLRDSRLLGTGLGGVYRMPVFGINGFENQTRYIHNGHLSLMLKISVVGYLAYVGLFAMMVAQAFRLRHDPKLRPIVATIIAWLLTFGGQNITQPDIMSAHGLTLLAALLSFLLLHRKLAPARAMGLSHPTDGSMRHGATVSARWSARA